MAKKSDVRKYTEAALIAAGYDVTSAYTFVDRSKTGHRVKISFLELTAAERDNIKRAVECMSGKRVQVKQTYRENMRWGGYWGFSVKIMA